MRIGMVLGNKFPPDIRVEKEARSLIKSGHKVYLLSLFDKGDHKNLPSQETIDDILVKRIISSKSEFLKRIHYLYFVTRFIHLVLKKELDRFVSENKIDILHIHDLPFVKTGLIISKKHKIPIIVDLHENYPAALGVYKIPIWRRIYFHNQTRWKRYEKRCLAKVNKIIVVVDEAKERLIRDYHIFSPKIIIVSNTVDIDSFKSISVDKKIVEEHKKDFIISYVGRFGPHRGLETAIKAMPLVAKTIPNAKLLLVGGEGSLAPKIIFTGQQPPEKLVNYISISNICLVPHDKSFHTDTTIPHKLFQYMLMKKPVIVSNCKPLERIINETGAGLVFKAGDAQDLADKIIQMYKNPHRCAENGHQAVLEKYNWKHDSKKLIELYKKYERENKQNN